MAAWAAVDCLGFDFFFGAGLGFSALMVKFPAVAGACADEAVAAADRAGFSTADCEGG